MLKVQSEIKRPFELLPLFRERVWGRESLLPYYSSAVTVNKRIGEIWFTFNENDTALGKSLGQVISENSGILGAGANLDHAGICPLLVKLIFTTERLSVQVHPDDAYAREHHGCLGKTEAWYVMDVQPPGEVAVGFREQLTPDRFGAAVKSGEVENLLDWRVANPGDVIFTPAGTVHAIGAGLTICEIQENSDVTYRLYDYGRPRELHLEHGVKVSHLGPHTHQSQVIPMGEGRDSLLSCDYFHIERLRPKERIEIGSHQPFYSLLICTKGDGIINGEPFTAGRSWFVPAGNNPFKIDGADSEWILTYTAKEPIREVTVI
ncbi:MAG: class I mannose-6-phosphate isomerase [Acidobacteriaceae bacterium]|nr:class I mannose-6-phosphate isomerase [Acidobacteriaceae bacterium]